MSRRRRHPSLVPLSHDHREALGLALFLHNPAPPGRVTAMTPASTPERRRTRLLKIVIDPTFPLAVAAAAHAFIESRQAFGRVVLVP